MKQRIARGAEWLFLHDLPPAQTYVAILRWVHS